MTDLADRLAAVLDRLGIARAFLATQMPGDVAAFCRRNPERIAGLALVVPSRIEPEAFAGLGARAMVLTGDGGVPAEAANNAAPAMPAARQVRLPGYAATAWSDVAAERPDELLAELDALLGGLEPPPPPDPAAPRAGEAAGLTWRIDGSGPALVLTPFFLAASQWDPVVGALARRYSVVSLGGAHIGGVAMLEDRASLASYRDLFATLLRRMAIPPGGRVLEAGCGSGALCRQLLEARPDLAATGLDANRHALREGAALARAAGIPVAGPDDDDADGPAAGALRLVHGDATALPFPDAGFDAVFAVTVLEECDAAAALAELVRVARPGAPVAVVVRAIDMPQWWNLDLPPGIAARANAQPRSVSPGAVADRSLYRRMAAAGLAEVRGFPWLLAFDRPDGPMWRYREAHARGGLSEGERAVWDAAREAARAEGLLFQANPLHCAVGRKPGRQ